MVAYAVFICFISTVIGVLYVQRKLLRWRRSYSLSWPETLSPPEQAAICKLVFERHGLDAKPPMLIGLKYHLEIWHERHAILISFGNSETPQIKGLYRDLAEYRQTRYPRGNCSIIVCFEHIKSTAAFDWSREFLIPILHPAQMRQLAELIQSHPENLTEAVFDISAAVEFVRDRKIAPPLGTLFEELKRGNLDH